MWRWMCFGLLVLLPAADAAPPDVPEPAPVRFSVSVYGHPVVANVPVNGITVREVRMLRRRGHAGGHVLRVRVRLASATGRAVRPAFRVLLCAGEDALGAVAFPHAGDDALDLKAGAGYVWSQSVVLPDERVPDSFVILPPVPPRAPSPEWVSRAMQPITPPVWIPSDASAEPVAQVIVAPVPVAVPVYVAPEIRTEFVTKEVVVQETVFVHRPPTWHPGMHSHFCICGDCKQHRAHERARRGDDPRKDSSRRDAREDRRRDSARPEARDDSRRDDTSRVEAREDNDRRHRRPRRRGTRPEDHDAAAPKVAEAAPAHCELPAPVQDRGDANRKRVRGR